MLRNSKFRVSVDADFKVENLTLTSTFTSTLLVAESPY